MQSRCGGKGCARAPGPEKSSNNCARARGGPDGEREEQDGDREGPDSRKGHVESAREARGGGGGEEASGKGRAAAACVPRLAAKRPETSTTVERSGPADPRLGRCGDTSRSWQLPSAPVAGSRGRIPEALWPQQASRCSEEAQAAARGRLEREKGSGKRG